MARSENKKDNDFRFAPPQGRFVADPPSKGRITASPSEFEFNYTTPPKHCTAEKIKKGRCTVSLNFIDGKPVLRLCTKFGDPGRTIPLENARDAGIKAKQACATFKQSKRFPTNFDTELEDNPEYDPSVEVAGLRGSSAHERSERLWAAVERARTREEREERKRAAEAFDARLAGTRTQRMMTLSLAGPRRKSTTTRKTMAAKKKASKFKWCVFKMTKSGRRKLSCHKFKRTAKVAAKRKGGRVIKTR